MSKALPQKQMSADEFLAWARTREDGRFELHDGSVIAMAPERAEHVEVKFNVTTALRAGIASAGLPCFAYVDGLAVRIDAATTFEPDALVVCGEKVPADSVTADRPVLVVEVLSPSTGYSDLGVKVEGYFKVASIEHYLIADPAARRVIHHRRLADKKLETRLISAGAIRIEPPGFEFAAEALFAGL
jgi:Uma2 family endonuclease